MRKHHYKQKLIICFVLAIAFAAAGILLPHKHSHASESKLQKIVSGWAKRQDFNSSVVVSELDGRKRSASLDADVAMVPASTYKLYVGYAVLHETEEGELSLDQVTQSGQTVETTFQNMIINSDDPSATTLGYMVGWNEIDSLASAAGATHTKLDNYDSSGDPTLGNKYTTANDLATILTKLERGQLLNNDDSKFFLNLLQNQVYRERIPAGVPSGVVVADKPGWLAPADGYNGYVQNDAAIVYGPKSTYVLVIMTSGSQTQPIAKLSGEVYDYLEGG